jgi:tripartite-type tricarboxylate transporter receptor subunit TctC
MAKKALILILVALWWGGVSVKYSQGKEYPIKPIEIMSPYTSGSSSDIAIRIGADIATKYLGQPLVVISKAGAAGSIAAADVISSKPDGYKLLVSALNFFAFTTKMQKIPFDPNDLIPLVNYMEMRHELVVRGDSPWRTQDDLLDYGRRNPGKLKWNHAGRGTFQYMYGLLLFRKFGIEAFDIPYKGSPEQVAAVLGGHVDASIMPHGATIDHIRTGRLKYLVVFSDRRYSDLPDVPCIAELGFSEIAELRSFWGLFVHKNTPEGVKKTLFDAFKKAFQDSEFKTKVENTGEIPRFEGPEFMKEAIKKSERIGVPIIKELGLYVGQK